MSIVATFCVNSFALDRYGALVDKGRAPVIGWRRLSERERLRYYLLTKLFGMALDPEKFRARFHADVHRRLALELEFFRMFGLVREDGQISVTPRGMYTVCVMQKEFFAALNTLRERYIERQV